MSLPRELVTANARVNAAYAAIPGEKRPGVDGPEWRKREDAIDAACTSGDSEAIRSTVSEWERFALRFLSVAAGR